MTSDNENDADIVLRLPASERARLDAWIGRQSEPRPSRAEAALALLTEALGADAGSIPVEDLNASNDE